MEESTLLLLLLRIKAGRELVSVGRRAPAGVRVELGFSGPDARGRERWPVCVTRGDGGRYGSTGISDTRLMVAPELPLGVRGIASGTVDVSGAMRISVRCGDGFLLGARGEGWVSTRRGMLRSLSDFPAKTRDSRSRGLPRVRVLLDRGFEPLDRVPRELIKTKAGRVGGSIMVTFFATWISAFSTEKIDDGEGERDLEWLVGGELGET